MQSPAGHRVNLMNAGYTEVGVGILTETDPNTPVGPQVVTEDFGSRASAARFVLGVAYSDRDGNDFYSVGEGRGDLSVAVGSGAATSYATGGYQLAAGQGATATLTGGGLAGAVTVRLVSTQNVKLDVVNGTELKVSGSTVVSGPVALIEGVGSAGVTVAIGDMLGHRMLGTAGTDSLVGGAGADDLFGGDGADTLSGGAGNDHLYGRAATGGTDGNDLIYGGDGADYLQGNAGADTLDGGAGSDRLNGGADGDSLLGGAGNDSVNGNLGNDTIYGGADNDYLRGGQGNDLIQGGSGNDALLGDLGNDTLAGGTGWDQLTGGGGSDLFVFANGDAPYGADGFSDAIFDYADGSDRLALGFTIDTVLTGAAQPSFTAARAFAQQLLDGHAGIHEVAAVQVGGDSYLFWAGDGGATVDSAVRVMGVAANLFDTSDFG